MNQHAQDQSGNAANGIMGLLGAAFAWLGAHFDQISQGTSFCIVLIGGAAAVVALQRGLIGKRRDRLALERELKQATQGVYLMDKPATTSAIQPPPSKPDPTYYPPDAEL